MKRMPLLLSLLGVIALSASIAYWFLQLYTPPQRPFSVPAPSGVTEPAADAAATLFGGEVVAAVASNYQLTGVVASGREGVAILVADGQPPRAVRVGRELSPGVTLSEVNPRYVMLSEGGVLKRIELATDATAGPDLAAGPAPGPPPPMVGTPQPPMPSPAPTPPAPMPPQVQEPGPAPMAQPDVPPQDVPPQDVPPQDQNSQEGRQQQQQQPLPPGVQPSPPGVQMPMPNRNFMRNTPAQTQ